MGKFRFTFTNILLWLALIASCLLMENVAFLTSKPTSTLPDFYFYLLAGVALICFVALFLFEHLHNKTKMDYVLFVALFVFLIGGLITIWFTDDRTFLIKPNDTEYLVSYTATEKLKFSIAFFAFILSLYSVLFIYIKNHPSYISIVILNVVLMVIVYVTVIYSWATEFPKYEAFFKAQTNVGEIKSLFWNSNMFAGTLVMGLCSSVLLNVYKKNAFSYVSLFVFSVEIAIVRSLLSFVAMIVLLVIYFLVEVIMSFTKSFKRGIINLTIYLTVLVALTCIVGAAFDGKMGYLSTLVTQVRYEMEHGDFATLSSRVPIWNAIFDDLKTHPINLIFGYGYGINKNTLFGISGGSVYTAHNGFIQILVNYGIFGCVLYAGFFFYCLVSFFRLAKHHMRFALLTLMVCFAMLGYSLAESVIFFNSNAQGFLVGIMFYLPIIIKAKHLKYTDTRESVKMVSYNLSLMDDKRLVKLSSSIILALAMALLPVVVLLNLQNEELLFRLTLTIEICLGVLFLLFPMVIYLWHKKTTLQNFYLRVIFNAFLLSLSLAIAAILYLNLRTSNEHLYIYIIPGVLFGVLVVEIIVYSIIKKASLKPYINIITSILQNLITIIVILAVDLIIFHYAISQFKDDALLYLILFVFNAILFYIFYALVWYKDVKETFLYIDGLIINHEHRLLLLEEGSDLKYGNKKN